MLESPTWVDDEEDAREIVRVRRAYEMHRRVSMER